MFSISASEIHVRPDSWDSVIGTRDLDNEGDAGIKCSRGLVGSVQRPATAEIARNNAGGTLRTET
jgi:hypothetical protein